MILKLSLVLCGFFTHCSEEKFNNLRDNQRGRDHNDREHALFQDDHRVSGNAEMKTLAHNIGRIAGIRP